MTVDDAPRGARVIVCGGRTFGEMLKAYDSWHAERKDYEDRVIPERLHLGRVLKELAPKEVAQGGATGADRLAREWALYNGIPVRTYHANWRPDGKYDRGAGPKRNRFMFSDFDGDGLCAFPGGRGTADMIAVAEAGGVWVVRA